MWLGCKGPKMGAGNALTFVVLNKDLGEAGQGQKRKVENGALPIRTRWMKPKVGLCVQMDGEKGKRRGRSEIGRAHV